MRRKLWLVLALAICLFLLYTAVGERGLVGLKRMVNQRNDLRSRVAALEKSNVELAEQVSRLRDDPATIEGLARTELGMVRDGETVYILSHRPEDPPK
ncbi:MAG: septum formation initiator family protein [bacterium]|nr:septum formation initiator family protein [bacterium]MDT8365354.1 septum formation initiator family protein [bacterium]